MSVADDYRAHAAEAKALADSETDPLTKDQYEKRAEAWEELALTVDVLNQLEARTGMKKDQSLEL